MTKGELDQFMEKYILGKKYKKGNVVDAMIYTRKLMSIYKLKILELLSNNNEMTISEIQRALGISYKETYRHVKELIGAGFLLKDKREEEKHHPAYISLKK